MIRYVVLCLFGGIAPVFADSACDDLWFVRNQIFDANGYCFSSNLGKSIFDNRDCSTVSPELTPQEITQIDHVKDMETRWSCRVDTRRTELDIHAFEKRRRLTVQPLLGDSKTACIGYYGSTLPLYAGPSKETAIVGHLSGAILFERSYCL